MLKPLDLLSILATHQWNKKNQPGFLFPWSSSNCRDLPDINSPLNQIYQPQYIKSINLNFCLVSPTKIIGAWTLHSSNLTSSRLLTTSSIIYSLMISTISTLRSMCILGSLLISSTFLILDSSFITRSSLLISLEISIFSSLTSM